MMKSSVAHHLRWGQLLALFMRSSYVEVLCSLLEGIQWLRDPSGKAHIVGKSGSRRRGRGWAPSLCGGCTTRWSIWWRSRQRAALGIAAWNAIPPSEEKSLSSRRAGDILAERVVSSRKCRNPRAVKRKMSKIPIRPRGVKPLRCIDIKNVIKIVK
jgi:hypothetical protein